MVAKYFTDPRTGVRTPANIEAVVESYPGINKELVGVWGDGDAGLILGYIITRSEITNTVNELTCTGDISPVTSHAYYDTTRDILISEKIDAETWIKVVASRHAEAGDSIASALGSFAIYHVLAARPNTLLFVIDSTIHSERGDGDASLISSSLLMIDSTPATTLN